MTPPTISCIIPIFNGDRYLRQAIDSILAQDYRPLEIIAADDGSTDDSRNIVESYGGTVRWVSQETAGPGATRNLGIGASSGSFLAFLNPDDLWAPTKLSTQFEQFRNRSDLDVSVTMVRVLWASSADEARARRADHRWTRPVPGYVPHAMLARRDAFDRVGNFRPDLWYGDGAEWFLQAREHGIVVELIPEVLVQHRMHSSNLSRRRASEAREEFLGIIKSSLDRRRSRDRDIIPADTPD